METYSENGTSEDKEKISQDNTSQQCSVLTIDDIFINLTLISKIEVGHKLIQNGKHLNIDNSYFQSITRWFYGANRNNTLVFIDCVLHKSFELLFEFYSQLNIKDSVQLLIRLNNELKNSINGLTNLKQTYYYDKLVQSEIDVMIDNIRTKLEYYLTYQRNINQNIPVIIREEREENKNKSKKYGCSEYKNLDY